MTFWLCIPIRFTVSAPERRFTSIWIRRVAMDYLRMIRKVLMKVCWETRIHDRFPWKESRIYDCIRSAKARRGGFEGRKNAKLHRSARMAGNSRQLWRTQKGRWCRLESRDGDIVGADCPRKQGTICRSFVR